MASKLLPDLINQTDIEEYLNDFADFSFELRVLKELIDLHLQCQHGGTYDDPITGKSREFDIRALFEDEEVLRIHLSVECKNLQPNFPLVMHSLRRKENESYNELIHSFDNSEKYGPDTSPMALLERLEHSKTIRVTRNTLYSKDAYVAKTGDQVGRRSDGTITATDGGVFDKISQAINSSRDLISEAYDLEVDDHDYFTLVCPVLVVPDSTLWQVKYSDDGARVRPPEPISHISYFIGKEWTVGNKLHNISYSLSHLEILTFSEIRNFVTKYLWNYVKQCNSAVSRETLA